MLKLVTGVPAKRDARPARQSSWLHGLRGKLAPWEGPLQLSFAGFVLWHFSLQAYRAHTDGALPESGWERTPAMMGALLLLLWLPFTVFALRHLGRAFTRGGQPAPSGQARALAFAERLSLAIVLVFGSVHGVAMAWARLSGASDEADLRAELVLALSGTWRGLPLQGTAYLCAVGAASFYAARLTLSALPARKPGLRRVVVGVAMLGYLLGSYAVIRCGTGSLLP